MEHFKPLNKAIINYLRGDTAANNYDNVPINTPVDRLETLLVPNFTHPNNIVQFNGDINVTKILPHIALFSERGKARIQTTETDMLGVIVRAKDLGQLDAIGKRVYDILTKPFDQCGAFKRLPSNDVIIGVIRLEEDNDGVLINQVFEKRLKFEVKYITRR